MTQNLKQQLPPIEDEIDLRELIKILIEYKKLIISIMLISTISGSIYSLFLEASYKTSTILEIGYFEIDGNKQFIQSPSNLMHDLQILKIQNFKEIAPVKLSLEKNADRLIRIEAESGSIEKNKKILSKFISITLEHHNNILESTFNFQNQNILDSIDLYKSEIEERKKITQANKNTSLNEQILVANDLFSLNLELANLKNGFTRLNSQKQTKSQIIRDFVTETKRPKIALTIILGSIIGFFTAIFVVFIKIFIKKL